MTATETTIMETSSYPAAFERLDRRSPVHPVRKAAFERFQALGLPTRRDEDWKYTSVKPIASTAFAPAPEATITRDRLEPHLLTETDAHQLVFVNGRFAPELSEVGDVPDGVILANLAAVIADDFAAVEPHLAQHASCERHAFTALNTAFLEDGLFLHLPKNAVLDRPVHVLFVTSVEDVAGPVMTSPRILVVADANSQATLIETYVGFGEQPYLTTAVTEIVAADNVTLDHYKVERETTGAFHVGWLQTNQNGPSNIRSNNFSIGGALVRNNVNGVMDAEGCDTTFNGLTLCRGTQHVDNHLWIDHNKPHCNSWEFYKSVLDDRATSIFAGRIFVAQDAQKTDAKQTSMNLLLSDEASANTKPQLEIFADDVKCTHGATIGQLHEDHMFYLRARGIDKEAARSLLIYAFANENIQEVRIAELRDDLEQLLLNRLPQGEVLQGGL